MAKLPQKFYQQDTVSLAKALLGKRLVRVFRGKCRSGIIVETEAYLGAHDRAAHTWNNRRTTRNESMYLDGGHAYVYFVYGMHYCFNVVASGVGEAVLIRALEPEAVTGRTDGPARLCKSLAITKALDGESLCGETIFIERNGRELAKEEIGVSPRIGVDYSGEAAEWPLRFFWKGKTTSRKEKE